MKSYPAKLILFGEYALLKGAPALSIPLPVYSGSWHTVGQDACTLPLPEGIYDFEGLQRAGVNCQAFQDARLCFESNIPMGYGLGSSGALCAAIYDRFAEHKTTDPRQLQQLLAGMEAFFHGKSSGIDPLTSYLNQAILIQSPEEVVPVAWNPGDNLPCLFLLDTQFPRKTGPLVEWFLKQTETPLYQKQLEMVLLPANLQAIHSLLDSQPEILWESLHRISAFQAEYMQPMIPEAFRPLWQTSLNRQDVALKICGAGGGGFILGFAKDVQTAIDFAGAYPLTFPFNSTQTA
jgi:mevalonate kinase